MYSSGPSGEKHSRSAYRTRPCPRRAQARPVRRRAGCGTTAWKPSSRSRSMPKPGMRPYHGRRSRSSRPSAMITSSGCSGTCPRSGRRVSRAYRSAAPRTSGLETCSQTSRFRSASYVMPLHLRARTQTSTTPLPGVYRRRTSPGMSEEEQVGAGSGARSALGEGEAVASCSTPEPSSTSSKIADDLASIRHSATPPSRKGCQRGRSAPRHYQVQRPAAPASGSAACRRSIPASTAASVSRLRTL